MDRIRNIYTIILVSVGTTLNAQNTPAKQTETKKSSTTDCPDFKTNKKSSKANYLEYLRNNQGKKQMPVEATEQTKPAETTKPAIATEAKQKQSDFYTRPRYTKATKTNQETPPMEGVKSVRPEEEKPKPVEVVAATKKEEVPIVEPQKKEEPDIVSKEEKNSTSATTQVDSALPPEKKQPSKFQKKLTKAFTKKNNRANKPNYKKCPTLG